MPVASPHPSQAPVVILADADEQQRQSLLRALTLEGCDVIQAHDRAGALAEARGRLAAIIVIGRPWAGDGTDEADWMAELAVLPQEPALMLIDRLDAVTPEQAQERVLHAPAGPPRVWRDMARLMLRLRAASDKIRHDSDYFDRLMEVRHTISASLDLQTIVQATTDIATQYSGAKFGAFFYTMTDEEGGVYQLYTLSGAKREDFEKFPMPRTTGLFAPTFRDGEVMRLADVAQDARGGKNAPYNGLPQGHLPVRSYMSVPVKSSSGEMIGALIFGHPDVGVFTAEAESFVASVALQVGAAIDNAHQFQRIKANERRFRTLVNTIPQLAWTADPEGNIAWYNQRWYDYTGTTFSEMEGWGWTKVHHPEHLNRVVAYFKRSLETGARWEDTFPLRGRDGSYRWFLSRAFPVHGADGRIEQWYGTNTDVTDQLEAENSLRQAKDKAEEASRAKSDFLASMSHEIRTPMNVVCGGAEILTRSDNLNEKQRALVKAMQVSANALMDLINDLLDISKIEARSVTLDSIPFSLSDTLTEVRDLMVPRAVDKNLDFSLTVEGSLPASLLGDPARLRQILVNLCTNAVKFTQQGYVRLTAAALPAAQEGMYEVTLSVADSGIGIPPSKAGMIFEKFSQADATIGRKYGGTGLGLSITRALVEMMGGAIDVDSRQGEGATFTVTLPLKATQPSAPEAQGDKAPAPAPQAGRRVLLVEDYLPNVLVARTVLEDFGYGVDVAGDGYQALKMTQENAYDIVLMDIQMPELDGLETTRRLRMRERASRSKPLPIIGMTAYALKGDREKCIDAGMNDYITKPFSAEALNDKILHHIGAG